MPSQSELFASEWHYSNGADSFGPATLSTMRDLFATGQIDAEAFVWNSTMKEGADWLHLGDPANKSLLALLQGEVNEARERDTPIHGGDSDVCAGCGQRVCHTPRPTLRFAHGVSSRHIAACTGGWRRRARGVWRARQAVARRVLQVRWVRASHLG